VNGTIKTHRVGIAGFAHMHVYNVAALCAKRSQGEMVKDALLQALAKWNWRTHEPGRLGSEKRQRGHFL